MSFWNEFKAFAMRGNVIDLAVAVVIGTAFGKIVTAFVDGIIMPLIGVLLGGVNIADKTFTIHNAVIKWGAFLQSMVDFTLIAFSIFFMLKILYKLKIKEESKPTLTTQEKLLMEIRDLLQQKK